MLTFVPETMTFKTEDLSQAEKMELVRISKEITYKGIVDWENPIVSYWTECVESIDDFSNIAVVVASTVMPLRFLLSVTG